MKKMLRILPTCLALSLLLVCTAAAYPPAVPKSGSSKKPNAPKISGASKEGQLAISGFQVPKGMQATLFAAEPMVANPVAFTIDAKGRFLVCETFRQQKGVEDNRSHMHWLHDDLAAQTILDRLQYFRKHLKAKVADYTKEDDRIRLIQDTDGDGKADKATVFADGFNGILEGTGAGVLSRNGHVYYTNIPHLWKLTDKNGDGKADARKALHTGYGVRVAFRGHDMHGLTMGPDGRLYFSIGDRGFNVLTKEGKRLKRPGTGAVFRCELDGSKLEVFAYGLRNPQELAFDDYGNLFTGDNNSDSGDQARWVYVVQGSDTGWRMHFQYRKDRGPWNREMMWYPHNSPPLAKGGPGGIAPGSVAAKLQPKYIVPPIANLGDGPSGLTYYPGVGLPERYKGHFFMADFRGNSGRSGIRSFAVKPKGAGFELVDSHQFLWKVLATDVDFGYDGGLYVSDWVSGWNGPGKGRIYRFAYPELAKKAKGLKTAELMKAGFAQRKPDELAKLLEHPDRRIRLEAQYALAKRKDAREVLAGIARDSKKPQFARLHAIWGLGQRVRAGDTSAAIRLSNLLYRQEDEILAQAVRTFGDNLDLSNPAFKDCLQKGGRARVTKLLAHTSPRVKSFAAIALGRLGGKEALAPLYKVLADNTGKDPVLRHACVMGLAGIGERHCDNPADLTKPSNRFARMGMLLAVRRMAFARQQANDEKPTFATVAKLGMAAMQIANLLKDSDEAIVTEATRAFDEIDFHGAWVRLADLADRPGLSDPVMRRALYANLRLGELKHAERVAKIAADPRVAEHLRLEAIAELQDWNAPPPLDRVTGMWRPLKTRKVDVAVAIRTHLGGIFGGSNKLRQAGAKLAAKYGIKEVGPLLFSLVKNPKRPAELRVAALNALAGLKHAKLDEATTLSLNSKHADLRATGLTILAKRNPKKAVPMLDAALEKGSTAERQAAAAILPTIKSKPADAVLLKWTRRLVARKVPAEIQLDLYEAAKARGLGTFYEQIEQFEKTRPKNDPLAKYRESIAGGNAARGREIFFGRSAVSCRRCHKVNDEGGEVGPDLSSIGLQKKRDYLLESMVLPNKSIAKGFDSITVALDTGKTYSGIVKADDGKTIKLMQSTGEVVTIRKEAIDFKAKGKSAMPEDLMKNLSKADLRDLVEFLSQLKRPIKKP